MSARQFWAGLIAQRGTVSLTKVLAILFALGVLAVMLHEWALSGALLTLAIASLAAAFGRTTFEKFLDRNRSDTHIEQVDTHEVREVREAYLRHGDPETHADRESEVIP